MYRKSARGWEKHLDFMILDVLCLQAAFVIAYMVRNGIQPRTVPEYGTGSDGYRYGRTDLF